MRFDVSHLGLAINNTTILKNISITFEKGRIHAVIGGNGAGKSSLMKVMSGHYPYQSGELRIDSIKVKDFKQEIAYVAQEVDEVLFNDLSIYDNLTINDLSSGFLYQRKRYQALKQLLEKWKLDLSLNQQVQSLTIYQKQILVIIRAILQNKRLIILDEPTASLSHKEIEYLFKELKHLKENVSIIFISHHIDELMEIADDITVLKEGQILARKLTTEWTEESLASSIASGYQQLSRTSDKAAVESFFTLEIDEQSILKNMTLTIGRGEILGVAGLVGAGKSELADYLFATFKKDMRIAYIPEERQKHGLVLDHSIVDNVSFAAAPFIFSGKQEQKHAERLSDRVRLKYDNLTQPVNTLSGGNQQKVVLMRGLNSEADIYICDDPTVGIDIGAKQDIYRTLIELKEQGKSVIVLTSDFNELLSIADRILVMVKGSKVAERPSVDWDEKEILYYAAGGY